MRRLWGALVMMAALASPALAETGANQGARTSGSYSSGDEPGTMRSDVITSSVRANLAGDRALKGSIINVSTSDEGVVTLQGSIPSVIAGREAVELAGTTPGVSVINNQLRLVIASPQAPTRN